MQKRSISAALYESWFFDQHAVTLVSVYNEWDSFLSFFPRLVIFLSRF